MKEEIWLLIGHGSRDQEGNEEFLKLVEKLRKKNRSRRIDGAFLELAEPNMREVLDGYGDSGRKTVWILPLLLFGAGHSKTEIPKVIHKARIRHPHVEYRYGTPIGIHSSLLRMVGEQIHLTEKGARPFGREETAVLIIGRGSSDPDANSDLHKVSRLLWEEHRFGWVETCFIGVTEPDLPTGIKRCVQLGAKRIILMPYFIFTGAMIKRVEALLVDSRPLYQEIEILLGQYFGKDPQFLELIEERFAEIKKGPVLMNCDLCKIQFPELTGSKMLLNEKPDSCR
ncbi:MAG: sirohydrochlorin chelatase [Nitrospirae bacterium]|nr:sirohydrochlorin chelatase [Nitrospirota bacterium]